MTTKSFGRHPFILIGGLEPDSEDSGVFAEYVHEFPARVRTNRHGKGPFCSFRLGGAPAEAGVYVITAGEEVEYVGKCNDLAARFGPGNYGKIFPRNCHHDGQSTNCKINANVLASAKAARVLRVWFLKTTDRKSIEKELVDSLDPPWNDARPGPSSKDRSVATPTSAAPIAADFRRALDDWFTREDARGKPNVTIVAGDLHRKVGGYPGRGHRMPSCCAVIHAARSDGDIVVHSPPSGSGASLKVKFALPRPS